MIQIYGYSVDAGIKKFFLEPAGCYGRVWDGSLNAHANTRAQIGEKERNFFVSLLRVPAGVTVKDANRFLRDIMLPIIPASYEKHTTIERLFAKGWSRLSANLNSGGGGGWGTFNTQQPWLKVLHDTDACTTEEMFTLMSLLRLIQDTPTVVNRMLQYKEEHDLNAEQAITLALLTDTTGASGGTVLGPWSLQGPSWDKQLEKFSFAERWANLNKGPKGMRTRNMKMECSTCFRIVPTGSSYYAYHAAEKPATLKTILPIIRKGAMS